MSVQKTMFSALTDKRMQAYVNTLPMPLSYTSYFPLKKNITFDWKTMSNVLQAPNIAADLKANNASTAKKSRPIVQSTSGDLPLMAISREMTRSQIKEYKVALKMADGDEKAKEIVQIWGNDVNFCFNGINSEYEYISWALLSSAGKLSFTESNNAYFANEFDLDYQVDSEQKTANSTAWSDSGNAKPIDDIRTVVKAEKKNGRMLMHVWMNLDNFYLFQATDQVKDMTAVYTPDNVRFETLPSLQQINAAIKNVNELSNITIHVVDQLITRESKQGIYTTANPFADNTAVFTESTILGSSQYGVLEGNDPAVTYAYRDNVVIRKFGNQDPVTEVTIGESDGIPVLDTAYRNHYLKTNAVAW